MRWPGTSSNSSRAGSRRGTTTWPRAISSATSRVPSHSWTGRCDGRGAGAPPDLYLAWGKVRVEVWTHKIDGLTESDFVFSAKCDGLATRYGLRCEQRSGPSGDGRDRRFFTGSIFIAMVPSRRDQPHHRKRRSGRSSGRARDMDDTSVSARPVGRGSLRSGAPARRRAAPRAETQQQYLHDLDQAHLPVRHPAFQLGRDGRAEAY